MKKERITIQEKLNSAPGSLRQVQTWTQRLEEIPKEITKLEFSKKLVANYFSGVTQPLGSGLLSENGSSIWNTVGQLGQTLNSNGLVTENTEVVSSTDGHPVMITPFGTSVVVGGRSKAVVASHNRNPIEKMLQSQKKRRPTEKLGTKRRS